MTILTIAEMVGKKKNFVEFIYCACGCGLTRPLIDELGRKRRYIWSHQNRGRDRPDVAGKNHWKYNGGRHKHKSRNIETGYWLVRNAKHQFAGSRGYVMEHRIVYEEHFKCCLLPWAEIHHLNENKSDNRIENLVAMTKKQHRKLHNNFHHHHYV